jgi:hypothetical protein
MGKNSSKSKSDKANMTKKAKKDELKPAQWYTNSPSVSAEIRQKKR